MDISSFLFEFGTGSPRYLMDLQFFIAENVYHHLCVLQAIIPVFIVMPFLTLEHPLPEIALSFTTASFLATKQVNGMIDGLRRSCGIGADAGIALDAAKCVVLAISMLWFDIAQLLPLFQP